MQVFVSKFFNTIISININHNFNQGCSGYDAVGWILDNYPTSFKDLSEIRLAGYYLLDTDFANLTLKHQFLCHLNHANVQAYAYTAPKSSNNQHIFHF